MLAYSRPFLKICGRYNSVRLYFNCIFYRYSEAVIGLASALHQLGNKYIRKRKIVGFGIVFICIKSAKQIRHVNVDHSAVCSAHIVKASVRYMRITQIMKILSANSHPRRLSDRVYRLYLILYRSKINL